LKEALGDGVVMAIAMATHTTDQVVPLEEVSPVITSELIELLVKRLVELLVELLMKLLAIPLCLQKPEAKRLVIAI
jgi:hypothetical protein